MTTAICKRCVLDNEQLDLTFDKNGYCNYCDSAIKLMPSVWNKDGDDAILKAKFDAIKDKNKDKEYDCIIGISGGIDSSFLAYLGHKYGLRMLGIHIDAGWNTPESIKNVEIIRDKFDIDLKIIKINEEEMMDLQRAYFLAEVMNQDVPQDHVFFATLYRFSIQYKIPTVLNGYNFSSESIMPSEWGYNASDRRNLLDIHKHFGSIKLKTYPTMSFYEKYIKWPFFNKLDVIAPLNYIDYDKRKAMTFLVKEIGFIDYGGKHCESVFTRLYQNYLLPEKFSIDKRKGHLSSLIIAGQITREEALKELLTSEYKDDEELEKDIEIFISKIKISRLEFDNIIRHKGGRSHLDFKNDKFLSKIKNVAKKVLRIKKYS